MQPIRTAECSEPTPPPGEITLVVERALAPRASSWGNAIPSKLPAPAEEDEAAALAAELAALSRRPVPYAEVVESALGAHRRFVFTLGFALVGLVAGVVTALLV